jgi:hypothetical protein
MHFKSPAFHTVCMLTSFCLPFKNVVFHLVRCHGACWLVIGGSEQQYAKTFCSHNKAGNFPLIGHAALLRPVAAGGQTQNGAYLTALNDHLMNCPSLIV